MEELQQALEGRRANEELRRKNAEKEEEKEDLRKYLKSSTQGASELYQNSWRVYGRERRAPPKERTTMQSSIRPWVQQGEVDP